MHAAQTAVRDASLDSVGFSGSMAFADVGSAPTLDGVESAARAALQEQHVP
jgi:hypothetical protein